VTVEIARLGRTSITFDIEFTLDGKPIAKGKLSTVCCHIQENRHFQSLEIPEGMRKKLADAVIS
jgi:acyl-CoA thioester hydrolase